jgi:hypothetical protein
MHIGRPDPPKATKIIVMRLIVAHGDGRSDRNESIGPDNNDNASKPSGHTDTSKRDHARPGANFAARTVMLGTTNPAAPTEHRTPTTNSCYYRLH